MLKRLLILFRRFWPGSVCSIRNSWVCKIDCARYLYIMQRRQKAVVLCPMHNTMSSTVLSVLLAVLSNHTVLVFGCSVFTVHFSFCLIMIVNSNFVTDCDGRRFSALSVICRDRHTRLFVDSAFFGVYRLFFVHQTRALFSCKNRWGKFDSRSGAHFHAKVITKLRMGGVVHTSPTSATRYRFKPYWFVISFQI